MFRKWLIIAIIVTGLIHLATLSVDNTPLHWVFKLLPMLLIIVLAVSSSSRGRSNAYKGLIVIGLVFSIAGDAFLLLPGDTWFIFGLASFLVGHLLYAGAMVSRLRLSLIPLFAVVPIVGYGFFMGKELHASIVADSTQSGLWIPVLFYFIVILAMCWTAIMSRNWHAAIGAILFVASDSILAWDKFVGAVPASGILIMLTYFAAQLLIAGSIADVFSRKRRLSRGRIARM